MLGVTGLFNLLFFVYPGAAGRGRERGREVAVLRKCSSIPAASAAGVRLIAHDTLGLDQRRGAGACAGAASAARSGSPPAGRRGPRPARPDLGVGARQSLREPAADRSGAAGALAGTCRSSRRWRSMTRSRSARPALRPQLVLKWPNDLLLDGNKFAGILIEGEAASGCGRDRHRRQLRASSGRRPTIPRPISRRPAPTSPPRALFAALSAQDARASRAMEARRALLDHPRRLARARRRASASRSGVRLAEDQELVGRFETSTTPAGWCCRCRMAARKTITAGDVVATAGRSTAMALMAEPGDELVFAPLGGVGEIGMNLALYGLGDRAPPAAGSSSISASPSPARTCRASI